MGGFEYTKLNELYWELFVVLMDYSDILLSFKRKIIQEVIYRSKNLKEIPINIRR